MWIFLPFGFFSVVAHRDDPYTLLVRARDNKDAKRFAERLEALDPKGRDFTIACTPNADYAFRIEAPRDVVSTMLATFVDDDLTYDNFKNEVARHDQRRATIYHRVWQVLIDALQSTSKYASHTRRL